jgi:hypothetical protein
MNNDRYWINLLLVIAVIVIFFITSLCMSVNGLDLRVKDLDFRVNNYESRIARLEHIHGLDNQK